MVTAKFSPGFRLSKLDLFVLLAGTVGVAALASLEWWLGLVVGIPVAHFFLFCNMFRVSRSLELMWAGTFVVLAGATILWGVPGWWQTAVGSVCVAALSIAVEMRKPSYHGVGWQQINPELHAWWEAHGSGVKDADTTDRLDNGRK